MVMTTATTDTMTMPTTTMVMTTATTDTMTMPTTVMGQTGWRRLLKGALQRSTTSWTTRPTSFSS